MGIQFERISRRRSNLSFQTRRRRTFSGCLSLAMLISILVTLLLTSWQWLGVRLNIVPTPQPNGELRMAQQAFDAGDLDTAVNIARQIWSSQPNNIDALYILIRGLIYRSYADYNHDIDRTLALQITTEAYSRMPSNADITAIHAFALQAGGDPILAARLVQGLLNRVPEHTFARITLALAYGRVGGHESALREIQQVIQSNSNQDFVWQLDAYRTLAISYSDLGHYDEAISAMDTALSVNNRLSSLHFERAEFAIHAGEFDTATASYFHVLAFTPENTKVRLRLCELSIRLGNRSEALTYCLEVTQQAPTWADGWYQLGREYYFRGEFELAQESLNHCSTLQTQQNTPVSQRHFECWYLQGQSAEINGDCDALLHIYNDYLSMLTIYPIEETWTYPPEGPAICLN